MKLTDKLRLQIDKMSYCEMLRKWRFAPAGDSLFQGDSGKYFEKVFHEKRKEVGAAAHTEASKNIGWEQP